MQLKIEIDYATVTIINLNLCKKCFNNLPVEKSNSRLVVVNGERSGIFDKTEANIVVDHKKSANSLILDGPGKFTPLFGRDWMDLFHPHWRKTFRSAMSTNSLVANRQEIKNIIGLSVTGSTEVR